MHPGRNMCRDAAWKMQQSGGERVGPGFAQPPVATDALGFVACNEARHGHRITTDIHNAAARQVVCEQPMLGVERGVKTKARLDESNFADGSVA